jgi:hypothetical protein
MQSEAMPETALPAQPTSEAAPASLSTEPVLPEWLELQAEYRARIHYIRPMDLSGTQVRSIDWTEHRARLHFGLRWQDWLAIRTRVDVLDGVLWGDNGRIGRSPEPNAGASVATHQPNATTFDVGLPPGADPLDADSYVPVLRPAETLQIDLLYADVVLPFGLLRIGRQPAMGQGISGHDGESGNRWGAATYADAGDRILLATKLDEAVRVIRSGGDHVIDSSLQRGVFLAGWYELADQGEVFVAGDNLRQLAVASFWRQPHIQTRNTHLHDIALTTAAVNLGGDEFGTNIWAIPVGLDFGVADRLHVELSASFLRGYTREISEGFAELARTEPVRQRVTAQGARAVVDVDIGRATLSLEANYASGDVDPRPGSDLTVFGFARDTNVGLLLFERILAYESARSAAVGIENLRNLDAASFPLTEVATDGRFSNAIALFPQAFVDWIRQGDHRLQTRLGVLFAWPAVGAVDPVLTMLGRDGNTIRDDAVNWHGGQPGTYYGTEFDAQLAWRFRERFVWTIEAAYLLPGDALHDQNGDAVPASLVENRIEVRF